MRIGIQITKSVPFRGVNQEFHNVYYYQLETAITAAAEALIDEVVAWEKTIHPTIVTFVRASCWSAGGTKAENQMLFQKSLSGTGTAGTVGQVDRERAILIRWRAGFDTRGNPVYLRKWFHVTGWFKGTNFGTQGVNENTNQISQAHRDAIASEANSMRHIGPGGTLPDQWELVSKNGRKTQGDAECHPFYEHHQLGDMWR